MDASGAWKAGGEMDGKDRKILLALTRNARMKMDEILISIPQILRIYEITGEFELFVEESTELGSIADKISRALN